MCQNREAVLRVVEDCFAKASELYNVDLKSKTEIRFNITAARLLGQAQWRTCRWSGEVSKTVLRFHPTAMGQHLQHYLDTTVPHEVAHLVCALRPELGRNHNRGWANVASSLGCKQPTATNTGVNWDLAKPGKSFAYIDSKGEMRTVTARQHNELQRGATYTVRGTGAQIAKNGYQGTNTPPASPARKPTATPARTPTATPKNASKASIVRSYLENLKAQDYSKRDVEAVIDTIIEYACEQGFATRGAARSCVIANIPKVFK